MFIEVIDCSIKSPVDKYFKYICHNFNWCMKFFLPVLDNNTSFLNTDLSNALIVGGSFADITESLTHWQIHVRDRILKYLNRNKPVLAICMSHQLMAKHWYSSIIKHNLPARSRMDFVESNNFKLKMPFLNSFFVSELSEQLISFATSPTDKSCFIKHKSLPYWGVQFHPEIPPHYLEQELKQNLFPEICIKYEKDYAAFWTMINMELWKNI